MQKLCISMLKMCDFSMIVHQLGDYKQTLQEFFPQARPMFE